MSAEERNPDQPNEGQGPPPVPSANRPVIRRAPEPPRRGKPWLAVFSLLTFFALALTGVLLLVLSLFKSDEIGNAPQDAERFVRCICLGEAAFPAEAEDPQALCGYAHAYDMLSEKLQADIPYAAFCEEFTQIVERHGEVLLMDRRRGRRGRRLERSYSYLLAFGQPDGDAEGRESFLLTLTLRWVGDGRRVVAYAIEPATEEEIR